MADRFRSGGTGTVQPNARGYGADIAGTITMQYWMEKADFARMPDPVTVYYSVDGVMQNVCTDKASVPLDNNGNACIFSLTVTDAVLDWVSLYPGRPGAPLCSGVGTVSEILSKIYAEFAAGQREYDCGTIRHAADSFSGAYARCTDCGLYSSGWQQRYFLLQYA